MISKPTLLEYGPCRFLITDCPTDANIQPYVEAFKKRQVTSLVRACDPSYNTAALNSVGIEVFDLAFPDGDPPPERVVERWLEVVDKTFHSPAAKVAKSSAVSSPITPNGQSRTNGDASGNGHAAGADSPKDSITETKDALASNGHSSHPSSGGNSTGPCVAVHCVAGLGRAPVLVAIALIEEGMSALDAIAFIRKKRRGALNAKQLKWLETYQRRRKAVASCCAIV